MTFRLMGAFLIRSPSLCGRLVQDAGASRVARDVYLRYVRWACASERRVLEQVGNAPRGGHGCAKFSAWRGETDCLNACVRVSARGAGETDCLNAC